MGDLIQARWYPSIGKPTWRPGVVVQKLGKLHYIVKLNGDGYSPKRHIDRLLFVSTVSEQKKRVIFAPALSTYGEPRRSSPVGTLQEPQPEHPAAMSEAHEQPAVQLQHILRRSGRTT